jgi:hypothetical protein
VRPLHNLPKIVIEYIISKSLPSEVKTSKNFSSKKALKSEVHRKLRELGFGHPAKSDLTN